MDLPLDDRTVNESEEAEIERLLQLGRVYDRYTQKSVLWKVALAGGLTGFGLTITAIFISIAILRATH